jgi:hypothetical protein
MRNALRTGAATRTEKNYYFFYLLLEQGFTLGFLLRCFGGKRTPIMTGDKPTIKIVYWTQHSILCLETMGRFLLSSNSWVLDWSTIKGAVSRRWLAKIDGAKKRLKLMLHDWKKYNSLQFLKQSKDVLHNISYFTPITWLIVGIQFFKFAHILEWQ